MSNGDTLIEPRTPEQELAFEKTRFEYCVTIYETEHERRKNLENKSRFYLSFITLFLGAVFFNIEYLETLRDLIAGKAVSAIIITGIYVCLAFLVISFLMSLISILASVQLKSYKTVYPEDVTQMLFGPNSDYIKKKDLINLYKTLSMNYTIALEYNKKINDRKANWTKVTALGIFSVVLSLMIFLAMSTYLLLF